MPWSQERVNEDSELLQRYLDGELTPQEACAFEERLSASPELQRSLTELQLVGGLLRRWADETGSRAGSLLEPTLSRAFEAAQTRTRHASLGMAVAVLLLMLLPTSAQDSWVTRVMPAVTRTELAPPAAIERLEAGDQQAQVFVVGSAGTPVVWLADDEAGDESEQQDPG